MVWRRWPVFALLGTPDRCKGFCLLSFRQWQQLPALTWAGTASAAHCRGNVGQMPACIAKSYCSHICTHFIASPSWSNPAACVWLIHYTDALETSERVQGTAPGPSQTYSLQSALPGLKSWQTPPEWQ